MTTRARPTPMRWAVRVRRCSSNRKPTSTRRARRRPVGLLIAGLAPGSGRDRGGGVVRAAQRREHPVACVDDRDHDDHSPRRHVGRTAAAAKRRRRSRRRAAGAAARHANDHPRAGARSRRPRPRRPRRRPARRPRHRHRRRRPRRPRRRPQPPSTTRPRLIPTLPYQTIPGLPFVPAPIQPPAARALGCLHDSDGRPAVRSEHLRPAAVRCRDPTAAARDHRLLRGSGQETPTRRRPDGEVARRVRRLRQAREAVRDVPDAVGVRGRRIRTSAGTPPATPRSRRSSGSTG